MALSRRQFTSAASLASGALLVAAASHAGGQAGNDAFPPGMCFSDEPMIAIYREFGLPLEDYLRIPENGPKFFIEPSPAIDQPFA